VVVQEQATSPGDGNDEQEPANDDIADNKQALLTATLGGGGVPGFDTPNQRADRWSYGVDVALDSGAVVNVTLVNDDEFSVKVAGDVVVAEQAVTERLRQLVSAVSDADLLLTFRGFVDGIEQLREDRLEESDLQRLVVGSGFAVSSGLSIGYVVWAARSGMLLSTVLSSLPAWRFVDPFPVLSSTSAIVTEEDDEDEESLESIARNSTGEDEAHQDVESATSSEGRSHV